MNELGEQLRKVLEDNGAVLVGYGDVSDLVTDGLRTCVSIAVPMPADMVRSIEQDPTQEYRRWYNDTNALLDKITRAGGEFLRSKGYGVREHTTDKVQRLEGQRTAFPHKSAAVRAGLGWIGKSCLLVTPEYGGAVRLSTLLTDAPLPAAEPMFESRCGACTKCRDVCPYEALKGVTWEKGIDRAEMFDYAKCADGTSARNQEILGVGMFICGKCFVFCPYTRKYIKNN
ncbi:MAG: 4Fe-4S double cluster binding domain-containing protein [Candidatus Heteroscillospira sp.]